MNMKKKQYIKPQMEVLELTTVSMLASSPIDGPTISDGKVEGDIWEANDRRGSWGNLWMD